MGASLDTHYDTLGAARAASAEELRHCYRRRAQSCHPDKRHAVDGAPQGPSEQDLMARINQAYAVLSDPAGRAAYDRWLAAHEGLAAAQRGVAEAARRGPVSAWPWVLLGATLAFSMLTVGTVLYTEVAPPVVVAPGVASPAGASPPAGEARRGPAARGAAPAPQDAAPGPVR